MGKQEFIDRLRAALSGKIAPAQVTEHINYYTDYINSQIRMGRNEEEVLQSLGDPRLIAKSIVDASGQKSEYSDVYQDSAYRSTTYRSGNAYQQNGYQNEEESKGFRLPSWLRSVGIVLLVILALSLVFSVLSFLAPLIFVMIVVVFLVKLFRDWLN